MRRERKRPCTPTSVLSCFLGSEDQRHPSRLVNATDQAIPEPAASRAHRRREVLQESRTPALPSLLPLHVAGKQPFTITQHPAGNLAASPVHGSAAIIPECGIFPA